MRNGLTMVQDKIQLLVDMLGSYGVVCTMAADGELLLELYSLLECLQPETDDLPERLSHLRFVPTRTEVLGLYLVYIPLPDVLTHLVPASTLSEVHVLCRWFGHRPPNPDGSGTSVGWPAYAPAWRLAFYLLLILAASGRFIFPVICPILAGSLPGRLPLSSVVLDPTCH